MWLLAIISSTRRTDFKTISRLVMYATWSVFKTDNHIETREQRSVVRFLNVRNTKSADVHRRVRDVYGENAMSDPTGSTLKKLRRAIQNKRPGERNATTSYGF